MLNSLLNILPIIMLFFVGLFLRLKKEVKPTSIKDIKFIVANIALPALLFKAFSKINIDSDYLPIVITMFLIPLFMFLIGKYTNMFLGIKNKYFPFLLAGFEMGMFGYAMFLAFFGSQFLPVMAVIDIGQGLFVIFIIIPILNNNGTSKITIKTMLLSFFKSPPLIAICLGLILSISGLKMDGNPFISTVSDFIDILGNLTMPLIMISLGFEIEFKKDGFVKALKTVIIRKLILIILAFTINKFLISGLLDLPKIYQSAVLIMFLMPPPFVVSIYMDQEDHGSLGYVTNTLSISMVVSVLALLIFSPMF